jgi:hypothetical protein
MIFTYNRKYEPPEDTVYDSCSINDRNDFEWILKRCVDGLYIRFVGSKKYSNKANEQYTTYFSPDTFLVSNDAGRIKNTRCIYIPDPSETRFIDMVEFIDNNYTDDIWGEFEEMFQKRQNLHICRFR